MLKSRVATTPDVNRLAKALERPGIDPRCWNCLAYVTAFNIDDEGPIVDVVLVPDNTPETARVGAEYAGPGFGLYFPLEKDTEVVVGFPNGDPDEGLVVLRRLWSKSDPTPQIARDNRDDVVLVAKNDANIRIVVQDTSKVLIQDSSGTPVPLALKSDVDNNKAIFDAHIHLTTATVGPTATPGTIAPTATPQLNAVGTRILESH